MGQLIRRFGLLGMSLEHSFSPAYFAAKFKKEGIHNAVYDLYPLHTIEAFVELIQKYSFVGLNVTIPYKQAIIPFLDRLDPLAEEVGAVNTIYFKDSQKIGYNTDVIGASKSIQLLIKKYPKEAIQALVLGTGGASKAIQAALGQLNIPFSIVSRRAKDGILLYEELTPSIIKDHLLIINTTPLGMYPKVDTFPDIPYEHITEKHLLFDLVYNPKNTVFLNTSIIKKCQVLDGSLMLKEQAEAAWQIWNQ